MNMALSTTAPSFSIQANKITNYTSPIFLQKQAQISIINGFSPLYKPLTQSKPSSRLLTVPAVSSSQGVGALVGGESNLSLLDKALVFDLNGNGIPISDLWKDRKAVVAFARHFGCVFCRKRADYLASKKRSRSCNTICFAKPNASWSEFVGKYSIPSAQTRTITQSGTTCSCRCWVPDSELQEEVTPPLPVKIVSIYEDGSISPLKSAPWQDVLLHTEQMDAAGIALILIGPGNIDQAKAFYEQTKFGGEVYADPDHSSYGALNFVSGASTTFTPKAGLKIIQLYMEGYRQDWGLSFQKDTVSRGGWQQGGIIVAGPGKTNISYIHKDKEAGDDPPIEDILKACCSYEMKS